jgi:hypothetical protein
MVRSLGRSFGLLVIVWLAACTPPAQPAAPAQIDPPFPTPGPISSAAHVYPVESGWFDGQTVSYYNFGTNTRLDPQDPTRVQSKPVWAFVTGLKPDGSPIKLEGQDSLFDTQPGDADYTDLWQAHFVTPAEGYVPNSIKSAAALQASGMTIEKQPVLVNCPIVAPQSSLGDNAKELVKGWVKEQPVVYFDFGPTSSQPGKVYVFITGQDAQGRPQLVPGQHFVFDTTRAASEYSDFRMVYWVKVDASYQADSVRSASGIGAFQVERSDIVVNYPQK